MNLMVRVKNVFLKFKCPVITSCVIVGYLADGIFGDFKWVIQLGNIIFQLEILQMNYQPTGCHYKVGGKGKTMVCLIPSLLVMKWSNIQMGYCPNEPLLRQ